MTSEVTEITEKIYNGGTKKTKFASFLRCESSPFPPLPRLRYLDPNPPSKVAILEPGCAIDDVAILQLLPDLGIEFLLHPMAWRAHGTVRNGPHDADSVAEIDGEAV